MDEQNIEPSVPKFLSHASSVVRSRMRMLRGAAVVASHSLRRAAALPALSSVRAFAGQCFKSDDAKAFVLAVGIAGFFGLTFYFAEFRREHLASVPDCGGVWCGEAVADAAPPAAPTVETPAIAVEPPNIKAVQNDDKPRLPPRSVKREMPPGVVVSHKTGARARVGIAHAARFQAYIDDLENNHGARIIFMGGIRPGTCFSGGLHPCGKALDVCQLSRGVVDSRCHLPPRQALAKIAATHGLFEGGRWCNSDYGHAQLGVSARDCGDRTRIVQRQSASETRRKIAAAAAD